MSIRRSMISTVASVPSVAAARRVPFADPEPFITVEQKDTLRQLVRVHGWSWQEFTVFVSETLLTVPSCMTEREAKAVIEYFQACRAEDYRDMDDPRKHAFIPSCSGDMRCWGCGCYEDEHEEVRL